MSTGEAGVYRADRHMQMLKPDLGAERMGGVITCMSGLVGHKSREGQVDDESPPAAVDVDLLQLT